MKYKLRLMNKILIFLKLYFFLYMIKRKLVDISVENLSSYYYFCIIYINICCED